MTEPSVHPIQGRVLGYLRRKGTDAAGGQVRAKVGVTLARLEAMLEGLDPELVTRRLDESTWCLQEVVDHLAESLEPAAQQLRALIDGQSPGDAVPAGLLSSEPLATSWRETVDRLCAVHASYLATVDDAVRSDPPLDRKAPVDMVVKIENDAGELEPLEWTELLDWKCFALVAHMHTLEHVHQIERIRRQLGEHLGERIDASE